MKSNTRFPYFLVAFSTSHVMRCQWLAHADDNEEIKADHEYKNDTGKMMKTEL
jgi:hypothetical protein